MPLDVEIGHVRRPAKIRALRPEAARQSSAPFDVSKEQRVPRYAAWWNRLPRTHISRSRAGEDEGVPSIVTGRRLQLVESAVSEDAVTLVFADPFGSELAFADLTITTASRRRDPVQRQYQVGSAHRSMLHRHHREARRQPRCRTRSTVTAAVSATSSILGRREIRRRACSSFSAASITPLMSIARATFRSRSDARITSSKIATRSSKRRALSSSRQRVGAPRRRASAASSTKPSFAPRLVPHRGASTVYL